MKSIAPYLFWKKEKKEKKSPLAERMAPPYRQAGQRINSSIRPFRPSYETTKTSPIQSVQYCPFLSCYFKLFKLSTKILTIINLLNQQPRKSFFSGAEGGSALFDFL